jgi:uncharacterized integral membrane protein
VSERDETGIGNGPSDDTAFSDDTASVPSEQPVAKVPERRVFVGTGVVWGLVFGIALAIAILVLIAQNTQRATVNFLAWSFSTPLIVIILAVLVMGVVLDELFGVIYRAGRRRILRDREELERLQSSGGR